MYVFIKVAIVLSLIDGVHACYAMDSRIQAGTLQLYNTLNEDICGQCVTTINGKTNTGVSIKDNVVQRGFFVRSGSVQRLSSGYNFDKKDIWGSVIKFALASHQRKQVEEFTIKRLGMYHIALDDQGALTLTLQSN
jgi:hypothetical protein